MRGNGQPFPLLTPMILELRDSFLVMGVDEDKFFKMDLNEVDRYVKAYQERKLIQRKETASNMYSLAYLIGLGVGSVQYSKIHYPSLYEAFPNLFEEEAKEKAISQSVVNFMNFANAHNNKMGDNNK